MKTICFTVILSILIGPAVSLGQPVRSREDLLSRLKPRKQARESRHGKRVRDTSPNCEPGVSNRKRSPATICAMR